MNGIDRFYDINITELDADNLFFSVVGKCKEKNILDSTDLIYVDSRLNRMIEETAKLCGKGYIREDSARIMLKNIFMILDSVYSVSDYMSIISEIKNRKLWEMWQRGVSNSLAYFDRTKKNIFHLEHFYYKHPELKADFAINLKNDYAFSNIYTHSFENAAYTKAFFSLSGKESFKTVCERTEILCTECALFEKLGFDDILPVIEHRGSYKTDGGIKYTSMLIDAIIISMCFSAFYRCDGVFPGKEYAKDILSELVDDPLSEITENIGIYLGMVISRYGAEIVSKQAGTGENILNVYASRLCTENIQLTSGYLAKLIVEKRTTEKGLKNLIHFA